MSCTRRKESASAIVLGAAGAECRLPFGRHVLSLSFDPGSTRVVENDDGDLAIEPVDLIAEAGPSSFIVTVLSDDASPAEVYS